MQVYAHSGAYICFLLRRKEYVTKTGGIDMTTETKFWKKKYFTMLAGQSVSLITSGILQMSIIFYLTAKTNSAMVLSIATLMGFLPQAVIGPFAGTFVDRHSRKGVMIGADLMIAATGGFLAVVSVFMELPIWLIMLVLFVRSIGNAFHSPASSAVTPLMVPQDQLTKCAGYNQTMQAAVSLISPAAAAFLYSVWSLSTIILLDIIGAVLACGVVAVLSIPNPPICPGESQNSFFRDMKEGYFELKKNKGLFALLWIGTAYMFFFMPISALYPLMSMGYFRGTPTHASIAEIAFAGGMLAGGILLSVWGGFKNRIFSIGLSVLVMGVSIAISGLLPTNAFFIFVICCTVMGLTSPFYGVQNALFQEQLPPEYLGRVFSLLGSVMSFAMPLGLLCSGIFAELIGVEKWFLLCGIGIIAVAVLVFVLPVLRNVDCQSQNSFARKSDD
jgi:DHA3 family macrolide efflux protein-like MFS transporter